MHPFTGCIDDFPVSLSLTFLIGKNPPFCKTESRGQKDGLFASTIMMNRWPSTGSNMGGALVVSAKINIVQSTTVWLVKNKKEQIRKLCKNIHEFF